MSCWIVWVSVKEVHLRISRLIIFHIIIDYISHYCWLYFTLMLIIFHIIVDYISHCWLYFTLLLIIFHIIVDYISHYCWLYLYFTLLLIIFHIIIDYISQCRCYRVVNSDFIISIQCLRISFKIFLVGTGQELTTWDIVWMWARTRSQARGVGFMVLVMRHMVEFKLINVGEKTEPLGRQFLCNTVSKNIKKLFCSRSLTNLTHKYSIFLNEIHWQLPVMRLMTIAWTLRTMWLMMCQMCGWWEFINPFATTDAYMRQHFHCL